MENPAPKPLFGKIPEEAFDHVQPGCTGGVKCLLVGRCIDLQSQYMLAIRASKIKTVHRLCCNFEPGLISWIDIADGDGEIHRGVSLSDVVSTCNPNIC